MFVSACSKVPDIDKNNNNVNNNNNEDDDDDGEVPDMDSYSNEDNIDEAAVKAPSNDDNLVKNRSYDISITYDNYYATPKMWLYGYSESGAPLTTHQIFADISQVSLSLFLFLFSHFVVLLGPRSQDRHHGPPSQHARQNFCIHSSL